MKRVALVALLALAFPAQAFAHATLEHTHPSFRQRLATAPREVSLKFDQVVKALPDSIQVYTAGGKVVSSLTHTEASGRHVVAPLRPLGRGAYTVRWHVI